jgi:hypothetical protein
MRKQNKQQNKKKTKKINRAASILEDQEWKHQEYWETEYSPKADEGYCNEATQSGPLTHSQSHQAHPTAEHTEVKHRQAWSKEEMREVIWCYMYCRQHFTENYKKSYEIHVWRRRNPECRIYMDAKKLMNQKSYIMKHKR